jgi:hypothetical protein
MSKAYLGAFVAIAITAVGAVDYINQAKTAGSKPGQFGVGDYIGTISGRFIEQRQAMADAAARRDLLALDSRDFLPEAPEGWTRHDWDEASADVFGHRYDMREDGFVPEAAKQNKTIQAQAELNKVEGDRKDAQEVYVYEKPGAIIALRVVLAKGDGGGGIPGVAMKMVANNIEAMSGKDGFAVIRGVTFREELGLFGVGAEERDYRVFSGRIGKTVVISARAKAEDADVIALLDRIDYDRLNKTLEEPVAGIGSEAPDLSPEEQLALAQQRVEADSHQQRIDTAEQQLRLQEAALEINHRNGVIDDQHYEDIKAKLAKQRTRIEAMAETPQADMQTAAAEVPQEAPAAGQGGGLFGQILGSIGFGGSTGSADTPIEPAPTPVEAKAKIKVNALGSGACESTGLGKRCKIGE